METSRYFERTLFYDLSPTAEEYYARSADTVFEKVSGHSQIEVRIQSSIDTPCCDQTEITEKAQDAPQSNLKEQPSTQIELPTIEPDASKNEKQRLLSLEEPTSCTSSGGQDYDSESDDAWSLSSKASSTALPTALDHHRGSLPPKYPGRPKLNTIILDTGNIETFVKRTRHDFRVFYIRQRNSFSRLKITKDDFEQLLRSCHVFPRFYEYIIGLGMKNNDSDVAPPPLKFRPLYEFQSNSYHGFECSYLLRYAEYTNRPGGRRPYSLRQFAVYHRYKPKRVIGCSTWIIVGTSDRAERQLEDFTRGIEDLMASNPFELHTIFLSTAIASWKPYLGQLNKLVTLQSDRALGVLVGGSDSGPDLVTIEVEDHQALKQIEDEIADLMLCLDSTLDTVITFQDMCEQFQENCVSPSRTQQSHGNPAHDSDRMVIALKAEAREIAQTRKNAESLLSKVQNTRTLISSLLEREGAHNINQQISALQKLERQGQDENAMMRELAEKNSRDSSSMRILTIITMIYLPCTIVSNFYSTQFVNQKELPTGGIKLEYTQNAYIFFAISIPLTLLTIFVWCVWVNSERLVQVMKFRTLTHVYRPGEKKELLEGRLPFAELPS